MSLILHLGYHKTGTTFLQQKIFPELHNSKKIYYLGRYYPEGEKKWFILNNIEEDILLLEQEELTEAAILNFTKKLPKDKIILVSNENLLRPYNEAILTANLKLLKNHIDLKLLITTRPQHELILSRYLHDISLDLFSKPDTWLGKLYRVFGRKDLPWTLDNALKIESLCNFPACREDNKVCICEGAGIKEISLSFYDFVKSGEKLQGIVGAENFLSVRLLSGGELVKGAINKITVFCIGGLYNYEYEKAEKVNSSKIQDYVINKKLIQKIETFYRR